VSLLDVAPFFAFFFPIGLLKTTDGDPASNGDSIGDADADAGESCMGVSFMATLLGGGMIMNFRQFFTTSQYS
jgi:hypothetical protein